MCFRASPHWGDPARFVTEIETHGESGTPRESSICGARVGSIAAVRLLGLVTLAIMAGSTAARATPPSISVHGEACDLSALDAELADMLAGQSAGNSRVSVVTRRSEQTLTAEVLFVDADGQPLGTRIVAAATCDDLVDSIALVIAMAIPDLPAGEDTQQRDVRSEAELSPVEPEAMAPVEAGPATVTVDRMSVRRGARVEATPELSIDGFIGGASTVTSNGVHEQFLLGARLKRGRASLALQARVDAPEEVPVTATGAVTINQADVSLVPCAHWGSLASCALLSVGLLHGSGGTLHAARDVFTPYVSTGVRIGWEHFVTSRFAVRAHVDGRARLTATTFEVDYMPVWDSSRVEGSAGLGLVARFL